MKHHKCDFCGFTAGWYTTDLYTGKLMCIECLNDSKKTDRQKAIVKPKRREGKDSQLRFNYHE